MTPYRNRQVVRFAHCDPAGILFYPRLFEMLNAAVEDWCAEELGCSFAEMHGALGHGVPTVRLEVDFQKPLLLGDELVFELTPARVGRTSVTVEFVVGCGAEQRVRGRSVLVWLDLKTRRAAPWPEALRRALTARLPQSFEAAR